MVIVNALNCTNLSCVYVIIVTKCTFSWCYIKSNDNDSVQWACYENMEMKYQYKYNVECIMFFVM